MLNTRAKLLDLLKEYSGNAAANRGVYQQFHDFIATEPRCCERSLLTGHLTGSAWLVSGNGKNALLMHHRKLNRWLQPGGHADGDFDLAGVALREAFEETGLQDLCVHTEIFDIDRHEIPARANEPAHWHYDLRFIVRTNGPEQFIRNSESLALAWFDIAALSVNTEIDSSIQRMAKRWLDLNRD